MLRINDPELKKIIEDALEKVAETDWDLEQRKEGYYETPIKYAELAHSYLKKVIPDRYNNNGLHHSMYDDYNWYDPCCGTGNLTAPCPPNMKGWLGMSTLYEEDIEMMREDNKNNFYANAFQYDFLNMKPRSEELEELIEMLRDDKKWIFILNPPYARSSGGKYAKKNEAQSRKIPETKTKEKMDKTGLRQISNQLSIQFLMILYAFQQYFHLDAFVVLFTPPKFFTSIGHRKFREIWDTSFTFQSGFCVNSKDFGTSNSWPILMSIWKSLPKVDLIDNNKKIGEKRLRVVEVEKRLSEWIESKPKNSEAIPCMNYLEKGDKIGKVSQNAIGYARLSGNSRG